jgi:hypothetical protein
MNLYIVTYKHYSGVKTVHIVAATVEKAAEGARFVQRQMHGYDSNEILTAEKVQRIDRVQK